jgi:hypothetical protein
MIRLLAVNEAIWAFNLCFLRAVAHNGMCVTRVTNFGKGVHLRKKYQKLLA